MPVVKNRVRPIIGKRTPMGKTRVPTKKAYEEYLNGLSDDQPEENWIIGGKPRFLEMWRKKYGAALRNHDPIAFQTGYQEWVLDQTKSNEN